MKTPAVVLALALLVSCRGEADPEAKSVPPSPDPAAEVAAPLVESTSSPATTEFVPGLDLQRQQARNRASAFDEVVGR